MTRRRPWLMLLLAGAAACRGDPVAPGPGVDSALVLSADAVSLTVGTTQLLTAVLVVGDTDTVAVRPAWTSRNGAVALVSDAGLVAGVGEGRTHVVAAVAGVRDSVPVAVTGGGTAPGPALLEITAALTSPVYATVAPGDAARLFVVEQAGVIRVVRNDTLLATPFLDIRALVTSGGERGLLSMAFHPSYATNGYVYVSYTDTAGDSRVVRYQASTAETADPATASLVLAVDQPYTNHNGGHIAFGPDGMFYVALGDGGSSGDPRGHAQNLGTLLGGILRLDVDGGVPYAIPPDNPFVNRAGARGEIWMYGLRNPWRFSFDRLLGDLYVADVGQNEREEVDVLAAPIAAGANFGWNVMEGSACYNAATCDTSGLTLPVAEYTHAAGCSITGGYVYRGAGVPVLQGRYLYADYCAGWVRSFTFHNGRVVAASEWPDLALGFGVTSFAEDAGGELYVMTQAGGLYRIVSD